MYIIYNAYNDSYYFAAHLDILILDDGYLMLKQMGHTKSTIVGTS